LFEWTKVFTGMGVSVDETILLTSNFADHQVLNTQDESDYQFLKKDSAEWSYEWTVSR
jgi:hypothetical protein